MLAAILLTAAPATEISAGQLQPGNEALHTEPSQDLESILTDDQKALLEKMKEKLAAGELENDEDISSAITECEEELQITLTDDQKDQIAALIKQINQLGLDPDAILSKAQELYEKYGDQLKESAAGFKTFEEWFRHIEDYGEELKRQAQAGLKEKSQDAVTLATMHGSKGLEFKIVYILDANEGVTPHGKAALDEDMEEERRLFYVAMTRAKEVLQICYVKQRNGKETAPSRFVNDLLKSV